jgi:hypothetical protein
MVHVSIDESHEPRLHRWTEDTPLRRLLLEFAIGIRSERIFRNYDLPDLLGNRVVQGNRSREDGRHCYQNGLEVRGDYFIFKLRAALSSKHDVQPLTDLE